MISQNELTKYLDQLFKPQLFDDYCPNGLQIEGQDQLTHLAFSVSATKHSIEEAIKFKAQGLIVHHGLFWKFHGPKTITGPFAQRVKPAIIHDLNLWAYHLPLDGHIEIGNAASLGKLLGLQNLLPFGEYKKSYTGIMGSLKTPIKASLFKNILADQLNHPVLHANPGEQEIQKIGIITGGANSDWKECLKYQLDAYITGEMSEHDWHEAQEAGIHFFAGGHHATEKFGIQALMNKIKNDFPALNVKFIDSENPA